MSPSPTRGARFLVCGGREYADHATLYAVLDRFHADVGIALLIHGAAPGADSLAAAWATERGVFALAFPAAWGAHGRAAGPIRNARMLREGKPDFLVAFPGGRGTADMVARAAAVRLPMCVL